MRRFLVILLGGMLVACNQSAPDRSGGEARVRVGPNILVSRDGNFPHVETMVAANPKNAGNLIGGAIVLSQLNSGMRTKVYTSRDGGYEWQDIEFPEQIATGGGDPQVAFSIAGTGLFSTLAFTRDETGRSRTALHVYRSEDGGVHWSKPANLGYSYDHDQLVVDHTNGKFAGRIYIGVLWGYPDYKIGIFRSDDDGRTFIGPVEVARGIDQRGINVTQLLVFSDGELFVPWSDFESEPEKRKPNWVSNAWFATSSDGGVTFSPGKKILRQEISDAYQRRLAGFPMYAIDNSSSLYKDRIYAAWNDTRNGRSDLFFIYSSDRGKTWSDPRILDAASASDSEQYQVSLAVNRQGILGVTWFDNRNAPGETQYNQFFMASIDGGETFTDPVQVSAEPSVPYGAGNQEIFAMVYRSSADSPMVYFQSADTRWPDGGDYMGLTADAKGVFHPFWIDARNETFHIWTASIQVERISPEREAKAEYNVAGKKNISKQLKRIHVLLNDQTQLIFDPASYDEDQKVLEIPVRVKNVSSQPIHGPLTVTVTSNVERIRRMAERGQKVQQLKILNASNGKSDDGATFDYTRALRDFDFLASGAQTSAIVWRLEVDDPLVLPDFTVDISGMIEYSE